MANTTIRLDTRRQMADGTYPLQIVVGHGSNLYLPTGLYVKAGEWDDRRKKCTGTLSRRLNAVLDNLLNTVADRVLELMEKGQWAGLTYAQRRAMLTDLNLSKPPVEVPSLRDLIMVTVEGKATNTRKTAEVAMARLDRYSDTAKLPITRVDVSWLEGAIASMADIGANSRVAYMAAVHKAVSYALRHDIIQSDPFLKVRMPRGEETRMRCLTVEKLRELLAMEIGDERTREYRDMFALSFYLVGINLADLFPLTHASVVDGRIEYRRAKTRKLYSIRIEPEAQAILDKYRGKAHLLSPFDRTKTVASYQTLINGALSELVPELTWYWARYTWATLAAELDIPKDTISEALGHSHGARVTGVYIKYNRDKVDEANRKVLDYVKE